MFGNLDTDLTKALDLAQVTSQGLFQEEIDTTIQDTLDHNNPLRRNIPRKQGEGKAWEVRKITAQAGHANTFGALNDTEEPSTEANITRTPVDFPFKIILQRGKVTQQARDTGRSFRDLFADEMTAVMNLVKDNEEDQIINGSIAVNTRQFDGLRILAPTAQTITLGTGDGGPLTLRKIDETIDTLISSPGMMIMSKRTRRELWALLQSFQRFVDRIEVKGGFRVTAYAPDIGIFYSQFISNAQTQGSSMDATDLFILDTEWIWMGVLRDFRMVPLSTKSSQFQEFDVRGSEALVHANDTKALARMAGITPLP